MNNQHQTLPPRVEKGTTGFVFATTGENYTILARRAARTLRQVMPDCNVDLFTDQKITDGIFNRIHHLSHDWFRPKMQAIRESRFERSVVLDADILVTADISEVFQILDQCDIAGTQGVARGVGMLKTKSSVPRCFPPINSGFSAVKASNKLYNFSQVWESALKEGNENKDQPALRDLLYTNKSLRFLDLGMEYNLIKLRYLNVWEKANGAP